MTSTNRTVGRGVRALVGVVVATTAASAATVQPLASFGNNPGALGAYDYIPDGLATGRPLVVVLHGCTQTAADMQRAGWNALADQARFAVLYPEQQPANNALRCFNWAGENGDPANLMRGQGENASIIAMIDTEIAAHGIDPTQVYIVGFSAGAAFTAVMLATWPDRFAGGAIMAGVAYRCATDLNGAYACQNPGVSKTPAQWGDLVRAADAGYAGPWPRVQIWQGATDTTVAPANAVELVKQWTDVHGTDATADATEMIGAATRTAYTANGAVVVETYAISDLGHAIVTGADPLGACTATTGAYFTDKGVCSTLRVARFFGLTDGGGSGGSGGDGGGDVTTRGEGGGCATAGGTSGGMLGLIGCAVLALRRRRRTVRLSGR